MFTVRSDGAGDSQSVFQSDLSKIPTSWSRDKRFILFQTAGGPTAADVWLLPLESNPQPVPLIQTKFSETAAHFSPNMRWIAYVSNVSGGPEVYVRPFSAAAPAAPAAAVQVSKGGGTTPRWRQNGELFYSRPDGSIMSVDIPAEGPSRAGAPTPLFQTRGQWDVASDGKRFLVTMPLNEVGSRRLPSSCTGRRGDVSRGLPGSAISYRSTVPSNLTSNVPGLVSDAENSACPVALANRPVPPVMT